MDKLERIKLQTEIEQAKAIEGNPVILKLRQMEALQEIARKGGKFSIGLKEDELTKVFD